MGVEGDYYDKLPLLVSPNPTDVYKTLRAPLNAQLEITTQCNNACTYCYNYWRSEGLEKKFNNYQDATLSKEQIKVIMDDLSNNQVFEVVFTGGEPLLHEEEVIEGVRLATEKGIYCSINTNLTTMTDKLAGRLQEAGASSVLTTLNSYDEDIHEVVAQRPGSYLRTIRGIKSCLRVGLRTAVNMVVTKVNQDQVQKTGQFVRSLGVDTFTATKVSPCMSATNFAEIEIDRPAFKKMLEDLIQLEQEEGMNVDSLRSYPLCTLGDWNKFRKFTQRNCGAGVTTCTIGANGEVRPCSFSDESYGNIFSELFSQAWLRMRDWRDGSRLPEKCVSECEYFSLCGAGCRMEAKFAGDRKGMDPLATDSLDVRYSPVIEFDHAPSDFWEKRLIVTPNLRLRRENFGGIIAPQGCQPVLIDNAAYEIIGRLKNASLPFSFKGIEHDFNLSQTSSDFFFALFTKEFFREA